MDISRILSACTVAEKCDPFVEQMAERNCNSRVMLELAKNEPSWSHTQTLLRLHRVLTSS